MLKFLPFALFALCSFPLLALHIIPGMGSSDALEQARNQVVKSSVYPYEDDVLTLNYTSGQVAKCYVHLYQDLQSPGADFVEVIEAGTVSVAEHDLVTTLSQMETKLNQADVGELVTEGVTQEARCYFCGWDIFLFSTLDNQIYNKKTEIIKDAQLIIDDVVKKHGGYNLKSGIKAQFPSLKYHFVAVLQVRF